MSYWYETSKRLEKNGVNNPYNDRSKFALANYDPDKRSPDAGGGRMK